MTRSHRDRRIWKRIQTPSLALAFGFVALLLLFNIPRRLTGEEVEAGVRVLCEWEFGQGDGLVHRFEGEILVQVSGTPTLEDQRAIEQTIDDLRPLIGEDRIRLVEDGGAVHVIIVPMATFPRLFDSWEPGNRGYFEFKLASDGSGLRGARVGIDAHLADRELRNHLIREELTQCLGLFQDGTGDSSSIFFGGYSRVQQYSPLDRTMIRTLYSDELRSGDGSDLVRRAFEAAWTRRW